MDHQSRSFIGRAARQPGLRPSGRACPNGAVVQFHKREIEQSIPERFERQVEKYGERTAIRTVGEDLSYAALNHAANCVARAILSRSADGNEPVALLLQHGAPAIVAILGILKAGKAYVVLDPAYPEGRLAYILANSQASLLVTNNSNLRAAKELAGNGERLLNIDDIEQSGGAPGIQIAPEALACLIYTSGSTGEPKGVMQTHCTVLHAIMKYTNVLRIGADDRVTLLPSCSTSAAVSDIFGALLNGASLYPFNVREQGTAGLGDWLIRENISIYHSVPTVFRHLARDLKGDERFPSLRLIKLGGEPTYKRDVELFRRSFPSDCLLYVAFGATEIHNIRHFFIDAETEVAGDVVPVGYEFEDTEVLILDGSGASLDFGCTGEIAVKSAYLSPGYWRRPDLTADAFVPVEGSAAERVYRTGDLGQMHPDGCLEVFGRKDFQVKIRGFRVELGEIESALRQQPSIVEAVVIARGHDSGDKQLVAYCVTSSGSLNGAELRALLREQLPDYMVPSAFVCLDALPLTPNGKLDRLALPAPDLDTRGSAGSIEAPRTPMEELVARIWAEVLEVERVGVHDDFFELGGHSLKAVQACLNIEKALGKTIPVAQMLHASTVEQLAEILREEDEEEPSWGWASVVPLQPNGSKPPFFFLAGRQHVGDRLGPDQPVYRVVYQDLDREQPLVRVEDMAAHSIKSVKTIQPDGPYYLGGHGLGGVVAFEIAHQLQRQGEKVALLTLCESWVPGSRSRTPGALSAYRLWQRARRIGARQAIAGLLRGLKKKTQRAAWRRQSVPRTRSLQGHRAAAYESLRHYVPQTYSGRITVVRCSQRVPDPLNGWGRLATDGVEAYEIPGSHTGIYKEPNVGVLARTLNDVLHKAQAQAESERMALADLGVSAEPTTSDGRDDLEEMSL